MPKKHKFHLLKMDYKKGLSDSDHLKLPKEALRLISLTFSMMEIETDSLSVVTE